MAAYVKTLLDKDNNQILPNTSVGAVSGLQSRLDSIDIGFGNKIDLTINSSTLKIDLINNSNIISTKTVNLPSVTGGTISGATYDTNTNELVLTFDTTPDATTVRIPAGDLTGALVRTVNSQNPDNSGNIAVSATNVPYSNSGTGLTGATVQAAVTELSAQKAAQTVLGTAWVAGTTYNVDDHVMHNGVMYKCKTANSDATWTASNWTVVDFAKETNDKIDSLSSAVSELSENGSLPIIGQDIPLIFYNDGSAELANSAITKVIGISSGKYYLTRSGTGYWRVGFSNTLWNSSLSSFTLNDVEQFSVSNVELSTDDAYKYLYVFYASTDSPHNLTIEKESNLALKTTVDSIAKNNLPIAKTYIDHYINASGAFVGSDTGTILNFIPVLNGDEVKLTGVYAGGSRTAYFYDATMTPVAEITTTGSYSAQSINYIASADGYIGVTTKSEFSFSAIALNRKIELSNDIRDVEKTDVRIGNYATNGFLFTAIDFEEIGYISRYDGTTIEGAASYRHSKYLDALENATLVLNDVYAAQGVAMHCYDTNKNWLGAVLAGFAGANISNGEYKTLLHTAYIRVNLDPAKITSCSITYKDTPVKWYYPRTILDYWFTKTYDKILTPFANATKKPIITFIDDDTTSVAGITRYKNACDTAGIKGCFAMLNTMLVRTPEIKTTLLSFETQGFQCITHGNVQDVYWTTSNRNLAECEEDLVTAIHAFNSYGFANYKYWATPYGVRDTDIQSLAKKWGMNCLISSGNDTYNGTSGNPGRFGLNRCTLNNNDSTLAAIKAVVDSAVANNGWVLITTHMAETQWETDQDDFLELVSYAQTKGMSVMTVAEAFEIRKPIYNLYETF